MQIDREAVNKLLALNDFQLKIVIKRLLRENGISADALNIDTGNISSLRKTLSEATDDDIERFARLIGSLRRDK